MVTLQIFPEIRVYFLDQFNLIGYELIGKFADTKEDYIFLLRRGKQLYKLTYNFEPDCDGSYYSVYLEKTYIKIDAQKIEYIEGYSKEYEFKKLFEKIEYSLYCKLEYDYRQSLEY